MSERFSTSRSEQSRLRNHILPKWGDVPICEVRPREITTCLVGPRTLQQLEVTLRRLSLSFRPEFLAQLDELWRRRAKHPKLTHAFGSAMNRYLRERVLLFSKR